MAIENTYLTGNAIQLGSSGFDLAAPAPLDTRTTVPVYAGLAALKNGGAVYEGMRVYVEADDANGKRGNYQYINGEWKNELAELKTLIENTATAAMEFKGAATALPENPSKGDFYKVTASFEVVEGETAQVGDSIVYDGEQWFLIPSGDDIEDTWRPVTDVDNNATLTFVAGDKLEKTVAADGTVTYKHEAVVAPEDKGAKWVEVDSGYVGYPGKYKAVCSEEYMSTQAYDNLINNDYPHEADLYMGIDSYWPDGEGNLVGGSTSQLVEPFVDGVCEFELLDKQVYAYDEAGNPCEYSDYFLQFNPSSDGLKLYKQETARTYITGVETDGFGHITGYTTATETVVDTNTTYTFEGQSDEPTSVYLHVKASDAEQDEVIYFDAFSREEVDNMIQYLEDDIESISNMDAANITVFDIENWNGEVGAKELAQSVKDEVDTNKATWDLAGTAVQEEAFTKFKTDNDKAIEDAQKAGVDAAGEVDQKLTAYETAHKNDYTNDQIKEEINKATGELGTMSTKDADDYLTKAQIESTYATDVNAQKYADDALAEAKSYTNGLAGNYDKAGAAADVKSELKTEIANKVDKVDGKDLIATSEIERLATLKNYDDTALVGRVTTAEGKIAGLETASATYALKTEVEAVDAKFADYTKTTDLPTDLGDFTNEAGYAKTADVSAELDKKADKTQVATDIATAIAPLATTEALNGVKATAEAAVTDAKLATALEPYAKTADVSTTYETKSDASSKLAEAKKYTDDAIAAIPAPTDYTVTITETTDGLANDIAKKYTFTQNGAEIGTINLAKELVVTSGSVKEVAVADAPYAGAKVGDKYIELVIANQDTPIYVPAKDLVDIYTAKDGAAEVQVAISNTNEISATLVNGGITEEKLADGIKTKLNKTWEEVGVAKGLVDALADGQVKANKEAIEKLNGADTVDGSVAKSIKDAIEGADLGQYAKTADLGDLAALDTITADKVTDFAAEVAKVKVENAIKADEATKATQDGNGKVIADTYAEKAVTYTKDEVDALLSAATSWGEF
jgi:hypothetical protein